MSEATLEELEAGLAKVLAAPSNNGILRLIVARTAVDERQVLDSGTLSVEQGLLGDNWLARGNRKTADGSAHPLKQITIINSRVCELIAGPVDNWAIAGDQLYVDFDIREENAPAGTKLRIGNATVEVTEAPHTGCAKFKARYGDDALRWVNSAHGKQLRLRGINARVVEEGLIQTGDTIFRLN